MKKITGKSCSTRMLGLLMLSALMGSAQAENIALRLAWSQSRTGLQITPVHAESGDFALNPAQQGNTLWRVLAKDGAGKLLYQTTVRQAAQRHVEVFDPKTGAIVHAQSVGQTQGVLEVSLPFDAAISQIELQPQPAVLQNGLSEAAPLASFSRSSLEKLLVSSQQAFKQNQLAGATATTIVETGPASQRMDFVFVGDGYTAAELAKWKTDAQSVINGFLADPLLAAHKGEINIRRVDIASNQSGVDEPDKGIYRDTAMDGAFNCYNIDRLLCVNTSKVLNIVGSVLAPDARDIIVVVSNSTRYGGSGGQVAAMSMNRQSVEVALHEIGHTAFGLADEYEYGTCDTSHEPGEGNVSLNKTRSVKWGNLINSSTAVPTQPGQYANGTVGVFQGGRYCSSGMYRPTENSRMRTLGYPWHAVNEGLAAKVFAQYSGNTTPPAGGVTQSGSLNAGGSAKAPSAAPNYVQAGSGNFSLSLSGPAGSNFDLYLYQWNGSAWAKVASSSGSTSSEAINYAGTAGYYYAEVKAVSGSGNYTLKYSFPPK